MGDAAQIQTQTQPKQQPSYITEVQALIDKGIPEDVTIHLFQTITENFSRIEGDPEAEDFRENLRNLRKHERGYFHNVIDVNCRLVNKYAELPITLNWRNVKFEPKRIRQCVVCMEYFYCCSANGLKVTCYNNGWCEKEYEARRQRPGTLTDPSYSRNVQEILIDWQPDKDDEQGNARLREVEWTVQLDRSRKV